MTTHTNGRRITTKEATIRTAAVEIKCLTISGKQVTLAVFRQLKCEDLIDYATAGLRGVPWGTVNYHFEGCEHAPDYQYGGCYGGTHFHVVWQQGNELRQSPIFALRQRADGPELELQHRLKALDQRGVSIATAILCQRLLEHMPVPLHADGERYNISDERGGGLTWHVRAPSQVARWLAGSDAGSLRPQPKVMSRQEAITMGVEILAPFGHASAGQVKILETPAMVEERLAQEARQRLSNAQYWRDHCLKEAELKDPPEAWVALLGDVGQQYQEVRDAYQRAVADENHIMARYEEQYKALDALDQLFIAV